MALLRYSCMSKAALHEQDRRKAASAAETAQLAENLPDVAAIEVTHLADLLISICLARTG